VTEATNERAFEDGIETHLLNNGYHQGSALDYDPVLGLDPVQLFAFIGATQNDQWERLVAIHGDPDAAQRRFAERVAAQIDRRGTIDVLRHGVNDQGLDFRLAYFRPASGLNPDLQTLYDSNYLSVTRQLHYAGDVNALDLVLFCNGLPVATAELKNQFTGQNVQQAIAQYRTDRDPNNLLFAKRAIVHFAVDAALVMMTTQLDGRDTAFLPFNKGSHPGEKGCGAGNPLNPHGHATAYLWEEIWQRDNWLDILARFVHVEQDNPGARAKRRRGGSLIFPRYHQWDAVRRLEEDARTRGAGEHYLVQHSAGSGKSNTIAWLAHRLAVLHDANDTKIFDKVVVITDRRILDAQLQDTVYQFEHAHGFVEKIEESSKQLAEALRGAQAQIIVTTLQKFPFIVKELQDLPERSYAVLIDEAHSSQSGQSAHEMRKLLGKASDDEDVAESDTQDYVDALAEQAAMARGKQRNLSLFAFTATPKGKTLEVFGPPSEEGKRAFHLYSMRQAIEEGFIVDVLRNYTTWTTYYRVANTSKDDPEVESGRATAAIARFVALHPEQVAQKAQIVVEHTRNVTAQRIGGQAKAMVVCRSRLAAVRWRLAIDRYLHDNGIGEIKALVAFSGTVTDAGIEYTEPKMNGIPERQTAEAFGSEVANRILIVAEKFQTGFDQPLLHTMFVDKKLAGVHAVQTLSRLNRIYPGKDDTFVLDFVNRAEEIEAAFSPYYDETLAMPTDPNLLFDTRDELDAFGVIHRDEIDSFARVYLTSDDPSANAQLYSIVDAAVGRFEDLDPDDQDAFRKTLKRFVQLYAFIAQIMPLHDTQLEKRYTYCRFLQRRLPRREVGSLDLGDLELTHLRLRNLGKQKIELDAGNVVTAFPPEGDSQAVLPGMEQLSIVIDRINDAFGLDLSDADKLHIASVTSAMADDEDLQLVAGANSQDGFEPEFRERVVGAFVDRMSDDEKLTKLFLDDSDFQKHVRESMLPIVYERARVGRQKVCPIGDLLGRDEDQFLEYKAALTWDLAEQKRSKLVESATIKTVAAFLNSRHGGTLLLGVADDGNPVGLQADYDALRGPRDRSDHDVFVQHLVNVLESVVGIAATANVSSEMLSVDGHDICRVHVDPCGHPVRAQVRKADKHGNQSRHEAFFVRLANGTREITDEVEIERYIHQRWDLA